MSHDPEPRAPRRVADVLRHLSSAVEEAQAGRSGLVRAIGALLDAPANGRDGLGPLLAAVAAAAPDVDALAVLVRDGAQVSAVAGLGVEAGTRCDADGAVLDALRGRRPIAFAGRVAPLPQGTRGGAAIPALSRGEVLAIVVAGTRSAPGLGDEALLLARLLAERAGRELERGALVDALASAEATARATTSFRDQILGIVGHDLRNPLGAVAMSAALLAKRGGLAGWQHKTVGRIRSSSARMERIIADLLSYTRTRLGSGIPIEPRPADLAELARKVVDELVAFHPDCAIHLDAEGELAGEWDPTRLEQVVSNLVANAVDHGDPQCAVAVRLRGEAGPHGKVRLEVVNRGEMPPSVLEHVFEPFARPPDRDARRGSGLGLGLYIAREIVRGHGGRIEARSAGGETRVAIELPRRAAGAPGA